MKDLFKMKKIRNLWTCGKSVAGITVRFFSMVLMMLTLCVWNALLGGSTASAYSYKINVKGTVSYPKNSSNATIDTAGYYYTKTGSGYTVDYGQTTSITLNGTDQWTKTGTRNTSNNGSYVGVTAVAMRGYKFVGWTETAVENETTHKHTYEVTTKNLSNNAYAHVYGISGCNNQLEEGASIPSNASNTFTIEGAFQAASQKNITVKAKEDRGSVTGSIRYNARAWKAKSNTNPTLVLNGVTSKTANIDFSGLNDETGVTRQLYEEDRLTLVAEAIEGSSFAGWYSVAANGQKTLITTSPTLETVVSENVTYYADFIKTICTLISKNADVDTFSINFSTLEAAIAYANNNANDDREKTLLMRDNYTLPAGNYTIPTNAILVIPYSAEQTAVMPNIRLVATNNVPSSAYCALTLASGAHIDVLGAIEVGGLMTGGRIDAAGENGISRPGGDTYGLMQMNSGSSITFYEGANLYAWGFVQGEGTIDMRRGAIAREQFQMYDWKGFMPTATMAAGGSVDYTYHVLPINQYHIQNIEVKTTYRPGSKLYGQVGAYIPSLSTAIGFNDIGIIGVKYSDAAKNANPNLEDDVAIFLMDNEDDSEDTWVRKSYDVDNDVQLFEANNSAYLGSLVMEIDLEANNISIGNPFNNNEPIDGLDVDSRDFALPITNNFKIHLLSGTLVVTQNTELLPGAVIEVDKNSTMTIEDHVWRVISGVNTWIESPQTLYLYDKDQWGTYVFVNKVEDTYNFGYASRVRFRPGGVKKVNDQYVRDISSPESLGDAKLIVHGTVDVKGYLKTTQGDKTASPVYNAKEVPGKDYYLYTITTKIQTATPATPTKGGASIISTVADAGTINLLRHSGTNSSAYVNNYIWQIGAIGNVNKDEPDYYGDHVIAALLKNADGSYTDTKGKSSGQSYCYIDFNGVGTWKNLTADGCFVYEVVENETVYYAKPREYVALANGKTENANHTYTSADGNHTLILMDDCQWWEVEPVAERPDLFHCTHPQNDMYYYWDGEKWTEKRYTVTWKEWDGTTWATYPLKYGVQPKFLGNIPQRDKDDYYTYDFIGWSPEITDSTIVTGDVTYTAQYDRKDVMYTITWLDEGDNIIEIGYFKMGEVPTCTSADMTNKEWTPAVSAVTGDAVYTLQTKDNVGPYNIKFVNWDGTPIGETQSVAKNSNPTLPADPSQPAGPTNVYPTKPALADVAFEFAGWTPTVVAATADAVYTATFNAVPITYTIQWKNDNGVELVMDQVTPNTVPQYNGATPVRSEDGENYVFAGWSPAPTAATADAVYTATYEAKSKTVDGVTYEVPASTTVTLTNLVIKDDGVVSIPKGSQLNTNTLILESSTSASGQLIAANNSVIYAANAYYDLDLNTDARHWHAFGVPWVVNIDVTPLTEVESGRTLVMGRDYDIMYYDGAERAANGPTTACWKYVNDEAHILQPGRVYMIAFTSHVNTLRFAKASGSPVISSGTIALIENAQTTGNTKDGGWNGIANPRTYHVTMTDAPEVGYVHNGEAIGQDGYDPYDLSGKTFIVGKAVYVQAAENAPISPVYAGGSTDYISPQPKSAPARRANVTDKQYLAMGDYYHVALTGNYAKSGHVYVLPEEDKTDEYVIGHDLAHMGLSSAQPQLWVNRYNTKLCLNTVAPVNGQAEYPLGLYAPAAGEYTIGLQAQPNEDYTLYITRDGEAVWNLSNSAYTLTLGKGIVSNYGLRLSENKTPAVATGMDEAIIDAKGETKKVLVNGQVYIIRGEKVYNVDGQLVK